jgi:hypothetical protein
MARNTPTSGNMFTAAKSAAPFGLGPRFACKGIGANESEFGWKQIVGLVVGFAAIDVGAVLALMARRRSRPKGDE